MLETSKRNVIYYNACEDGTAKTLTAAHHSFAFFMRRGGSSMTTIIEAYEKKKDFLRTEQNTQSQGRDNKESS